MATTTMTTTTTTLKSAGIPPQSPGTSSNNGGGTGRKHHESRRSSRTSSYVVDSNDQAYRPNIAPRNVIIQRTSSRAASVSSSPAITRRYSVGGGILGGYEAVDVLSGRNSRAYSTEAASGVSSVLSSRESEKKDMQDLNERFAGYIEKVRFLEAQNRRLADELSKLKARWGKETTQVKLMYETELHEARRCLDEGDKEKSELQIKIVSLREQLEELRRRLGLVSHALTEEEENHLNVIRILKDVESELFATRKRLELLESDKDRDQRLIKTLQETLLRVRIDLDNQTLLHVDAENRRQTLEEELEFLKAVHEQEIKELTSLAYRDTTIETREYWKNEMGNALREIHDLYDEKMDSLRNELETFYTLKIQETRASGLRQNLESVRSKKESTQLSAQVGDLRSKIVELESLNASLKRELENLRCDSEARERELENEVTELTLEVTKLRSELEAVLLEIQGILDSKLGLELEISMYRKLLECEENRTAAGAITDGESVESGSEQRQLGVLTRYSASEEQRLKLELDELKASSSSTACSTSATDLPPSFIMHLENPALWIGATLDRLQRPPSGSSCAASKVDVETTKVTQVVKGEMAAKKINSRNAKGPIAIAECDSDGKFVTIENTGKKDEVLTGWSIKRSVDGEEKTKFIFEQVTIYPQTKLKIWAKGCKTEDAAETDQEYSEVTWGTGLQIQTKLTNPHGEVQISNCYKDTPVTVTYYLLVLKE